MKKFLTLIAGMMLAAGGLAIPTLQQPAEAQSFCPSMSVVTNYAYLKAGPSMGYKTIRTAKRGERLNRTGVRSQAGWYQVSTSGGTTAWVHTSTIRCDSATSGRLSGRLTCANVTVTGPSGAYLKTKPRLSSATFRTAARGETLLLESPGSPIEYAGWYQIRNTANNKLYWVHNSVIKCK